MTDNWSKPLIGGQKEIDSKRADKPGFFHQTFGKPSGIDDRAREIEEHLGFDR